MTLEDVEYMRSMDSKLIQQNFKNKPIPSKRETLWTYDKLDQPVLFKVEKIAGASVMKGKFIDH